MNITDIEMFFYTLGLPMYVETFQINSVKSLIDMDPSELEISLKIKNKLHLKIILNALEYAKLLV